MSESAITTDVWNIEIEIIRGVVSKDHIHILISTPPTMCPSEIMRRIKRRMTSKYSKSIRI